jgi:hypothetical protein
VQNSFMIFFGQAHLKVMLNPSPTTGKDDVLCIQVTEEVDVAHS